MDKSYRLTDPSKHSDLIRELSELEKELSKKYSHDVVLIAYSGLKEA